MTEAIAARQAVHFLGIPEGDLELKYMKQWGYGEGYQHAHQSHYFPTGRGVEKGISERLEEIRRLKEERRK